MTQGLLENKQRTHGDDVGRYLLEIRDYPRLTPEQERELAMACKEGNEEAIRTMVTSNLRLVVSVAREYSDRGVPLLDLIQEGSIGLLIAAKKFDYTLQFRFSTYATKWIRQRISRYLLNHAGLIRVPQHTAEKMRQLLKARSELQKSLNREPTVQELSQNSQLPEEKVQELLNLLPEVCSLDAPMGSEDDGALQLLLEDVQAPQPYESLIRKELKEILEGLLEQLNERQRYILRLRFGMEDGVCYSLEEIRQKLDISKERVRQIEQQAIAKLKKLGAGLGLEEFLS